MDNDTTMLTILSYIGFIVACFAFAWFVWNTVVLCLEALAQCIILKSVKYNFGFMPFMGSVAFTYIMAFLFIF